MQILNLTPDWCTPACSRLPCSCFRALAAGSATWGALAARRGIDTALVWAGGGAVLSTVLAVFPRLPDTMVWI